MWQLSECHYFLHSQLNYNWVSPMVHWGLLLVSYDSNSFSLQLHTWFNIGVTFSVSNLIHPCTLTSHIMCLIMLVMNVFWGIVVILQYFDIASVYCSFFLFIHDSLVWCNRSIECHKWFHVIIKLLSYFLIR